eukprot:6633350-Pyramimonas_sp.AAC.1
MRHRAMTTVEILNIQRPCMFTDTNSKPTPRSSKKDGADPCRSNEQSQWATGRLTKVPPALWA